MRPACSEVALPQRRNEVEHPLVLGDDMTGTTGIDRVGRPPPSTDSPRSCTSRSVAHAEIGGGPFARCAPRGVLTAGMTVTCVRIDDQQRDAGGVRVERHRLHGDLAEVDQHRLARFAEQAGQLIQQTCWGADVFVLGGLRDPRLLDAVDVGVRRPPVIAPSDRTFQRGRRRRGPSPSRRRSRSSSCRRRRGGPPAQRPHDTRRRTRPSPPRHPERCRAVSRPRRPRGRCGR